MKKKFIKNLGLFLFVNVIVKTIYVFGIDIEVQNTVGEAEYGIYFPLLNFAIIFQILLDLGIENFNRREIARNPQLTGKYLSGTIVFKLLLGIVYFIICFSIAMLYYGYDEYKLKLLSILLFNQFLFSFILYLRANMGGMHLFKLESIISVLDKTFLIIICGVLLTGKFLPFPFKIEWLIISQTIAYFLSLLISLAILSGKVEHFRISFEIKQYIPIIKKLQPYALLILLMAIYFRGDAIWLSGLLSNGDEQAGIYAHSFRILDYLTNYAYLFPLLLLPIFSKMLKEKQSIQELLQLSFLLLVIPSVIILSACIFYKTEIIRMLYGEEHLEESAKIFGLLPLSYFGMCVSYTFGALLTANGNLKQLNIMALIAVIISTTLNIVLIPYKEAYGSAIANVSTQGFTIILHIILAYRIFSLRINYKLIIKTLLLIICIVITGICLKNIGLQWFIKFSVIIITGFLLSIIMGLLSIKNIIRIIKNTDDE